MNYSEYSGDVIMTTFIFSPVKNKETENAVKLLKKNNCFEQIIYVSTPGSLNRFQKAVKSGDTIEFHADGLPWVTGGVNYNPKYDNDAYSLAKLFAENMPTKGLPITIDLRFCTSGVTVKGPKGNLCFAKDFSKALKFHGVDNVTVYGYTGYVNSKGLFKQSLSEVGDSKVHGAKVKHCKLEEGRVTYKDGILTNSPKITLVTKYSYDLDEYNRDKTLRDYLTQKHALKKQSSKVVPLSETKPNQIATISTLSEKGSLAKSEAKTYLPGMANILGTFAKAYLPVERENFEVAAQAFEMSTFREKSKNSRGIII